MRPKFAFAAAMLVILAAALALRLPRLGDRPFHGDEAVHAFKFRELWEKGRYQYDPHEYHGPTIYYAALPVVAAKGRATFAETREADYRLAVALIGAAMVLLYPLLRDALGAGGVLWPALLTAVSAPFVFYSRYFIQEVPLACFTLALIAFGWRYRVSGRTQWLIGAAVSAGLMIATKETSVLILAALLIAVCAARLTPGPSPPTARRGVAESAALPVESKAAGSVPPGLGKCAGGGNSVTPLHEVCGEGPGVRRSGQSKIQYPKSVRLALALLLALAVAFVFLSGCFSHLRGPLGYFEAYGPWLHRAGGTEIHRHPWHYYLSLLAWQHPEGSGSGPWTELFILGLAVAGALAACSRKTLARIGARPGFARLTLVYTLALTTVYSLIPYKTPWNLLSFYLGVLLLAGLGAAAILALVRPGPLKAVAALLLLAGAGHLAWQARRTTFQYRDDNTGPYAYAQPLRGVREIEQRINDLAAFSPQGNATVAQVVFKDSYYWPLPWYLRRLQNVGYWTGRVPEEAAARLAGAPILLSSAEFDEEMTRRLSVSHYMTGFHSLRTGVLVQLWVKNELWEPFVTSRTKNRSQ